MPRLEQTTYSLPPKTTNFVTWLLIFHLNPPPHCSMKKEKNRRLAAIMFTDIVGYTALMQKDEAAATKAREHHRNVFDRHHETRHGEILQYYGDGTLSIFQSAVEAVQCAIAIQQDLQGEVPIRVGLHLGDIVTDGTEVYGDGVNLASRIESMGVAGGILMTKAINDELKNQPQITTQSLGQFELKNVEEPVEVFTVTNEGIRVPERSELKGKQKKQTKTIAVLPFVNMSPSQDNEYFSDGMTEEIINALAKINSLKVTSRTSSFFFKNKNIPIQEIGASLNVSTILEGSIRLAGNRMRITAQLIDVHDDFHFWSETFDRSMEDIFAVQDEISLLIADKLREHIGHFDIEEHLVETPEISVDAYQDYLKSRYLILQMGQSDIRKGKSLLEEIIVANPKFAPAYLGMHLAYTLLGTLGFMPAQEAFAEGHPYLVKAMELDENQPECHLHLAWLSFLQEWDLPATYNHLSKALEMRPIVDTYQTLTSVLVAEGKYPAAMNYIETAIQIDPFSPINCHLKGYIYYLQGKYAAAIELFKKGIEYKADSNVSLLYWGQALILMDRAEESLTYFQNLSVDASDPVKLGGATLAYAALGETQKAVAGVARLEAALEADFQERVINLLILCHTQLGNHEKAISYIEQGVKYRLPLMVYLYVEPLLKPLRTYPRFQELMRTILGETTSFDYPDRKYKKALIDKKELKKYKQQLERLMQQEAPYLDPALSLRDLAKRMDIPSNHLSQLLNEGFDKNFSEFINSYRLETFKAKVADPKQRHLTILALAYDSGFNSKTVFNTFFKKMMGKTPKAYWKEVVEDA